MGVAVLHPQDCLKEPFSHMKYPRNLNSCPNRQKKPVSSRTRRSPPRNQASRSPSPVAPPLPPTRAVVSAFVPKGTVKKSSNNQQIPKIRVVVGQVRILKRGEEIPKKPADLVVEKSDLVVEKSDLVVEKSDLVVEKSDLVVEKSDLGFIRRIGPDPDMIPSHIRPSGRKTKAAPFYAGPVTMTSPPPSAVPLPAFFTTKNATDATNDLIRILRLDIA